MPKGKKNVYECHDCHSEIVTLDLVDGTTPFMLACHVTPGCHGMMTSAWACASLLGQCRLRNQRTKRLMGKCKSTYHSI